MQSCPLGPEESVCVRGCLKKGTERSFGASSALSCRRWAGIRVAMPAGGCSALGVGWPMICLLAYFAVFPVGLSLTESRGDGTAEGIKGRTWQQREEQGRGAVSRKSEVLGLLALPLRVGEVLELLRPRE